MAATTTTRLTQIIRRLSGICSDVESLEYLRAEAIASGNVVDDNNVFTRLIDERWQEMRRLRMELNTITRISDPGVDLTRPMAAAAPPVAAAAVAPPPVAAAVARQPRRRRRTVYSTHGKLSRKGFYDHIDSYRVLKRHLKDGPVNCGICSASLMQGGTCHSPGCKHQFCSTCLYKWLTEYCHDATCPSCRYGVRSHVVKKKKKKKKKKKTRRTTPAASDNGPSDSDEDISLAEMMRRYNERRI